jgi:AcrR family transcriptional regulator
MATTARIEEFADATLRVVVRDGLAGVSYRSVAAESGWSLGAVQKAFPTKRHLLGAALRRTRTLVPAKIGTAPGHPTLRSRLVELVLLTLPLDEQRRRVVLVGMAFADRAPYDAAIAQSLADGDAEIRGNLQLLFRRAVHEGELDPSIDHEHLARLILSLAAGLAGQLLYDSVPENQVRALVDMAIHALLTPSPPSGGAPR